MSNIITSQIRADREYQQLSELARQNFGAAGEGRTVEDACPYGTPSVIFLRKCHLPREGG